MNVSIICACKNRNKPLSISLQSWLLFDEVKEVIIVDWSSDESLSYLTKIDSRVKVIRVPNKKYFNQPQPLNLAANIATGEYILKFDVDHVINPYWNFFENYKIDENTFASGKSSYKSPEYVSDDGATKLDLTHMKFDDIVDYCNSYSEYYKSLFGMLYTTKENFFKCGGYNEDLGEFYGFEDQELQIRMEMMGLNHIKMNYDHNLFHIPHPDSKRIENFKASHSEDYMIEHMKSNLSQYYSGDQLKYQLEYGITQYHVNRNRDSFSNPETYFIPQKTKWSIKKVNEQNYIATEMNNLENFPPVYYVTLEDCLDRQEKIENQFKKYGIEPKAIKSKKYSDSEENIVGKYVYQLTGPTRGCVTSHLKAIKTWYESNESDYAFFCEDDLSLNTVEHWNFKWEEFIEKLPDDCECVQLTTIRSDFDGVYFRDRKWDDWSETAYIMNRDYAKKIIDSYCIEDTFKLEIKDVDVMPIGENILFTNNGKVYTFPLFVENIDIPTTDVNDPELENGQKPNHVYSSEYVSNWWRDNGKNKTIDELMGNEISKKSFVIMETEENSDKKQNNLKHNIVDCFTYFNEEELLELRVNLLKDHVDKFVIVDGNYTHSGAPKDYTCKNTIKKLGLPEDIIEVIEVDLSEENLEPALGYEAIYDPSLTHASRERTQRDAIAKCLLTNNFDDETVFIVSDCDEIINPDYIPMLANLARTSDSSKYIFKYDLTYLEGRANLRAYHKDTGNPRDWSRSLFACLKEQMQKVNLTFIRSDTFNPYEIVWPFTEGRLENGNYIPGEKMRDLGWHFTWMGGNEKRLIKSQNICHYNSDLENLLYKNYFKEKEKWEDFFLNYDMNNENMCPSGDINYVVKPYSTENLPKIIFDLPRVKKYLLPEEVTIVNFTENNNLMNTQKGSSFKKLIVKKGSKDTKNQLEKLLYDFSMDTENPEANFNLGLWYEENGHTAPALSYFLRCAERSTDDDFTYEALLKCHHCYDRQGTRDGTAISILQQAICVLPKRPEAYFLLSRFHERRQQWCDSYKYASIALKICDFDCKPLNSNTEYPGKYGLLYEKAISGYWWGKGEETRKLFREIKDNYELDPLHFQSVQENLMKLGSGHIPEEEIKYNKSKYDRLKFKFPGSEEIEKNYSQAYQDMFVLAILNGKKNGTYLEIGAQEPFYQNNSALLETMYDWKGISIEIREDLCKMFEEQRKNTILCKDATKIDYEKLLDEFGQGTIIDYLQVDCEPASTTFEILTSIPFEKYKFAVITYEHDFSADATSSYRSKSRRYLKSLGYELAVKDVAPNDEYTFEDWWIHPDLIDPKILDKMRSVDVEVTNIVKYFFE